MTSSAEESSSQPYAQDALICSVCLEEVKLKGSCDAAVAPGCCGQLFHMSCMNVLIRSGHKKCPNCRVLFFESLCLHQQPHSYSSYHHGANLSPPASSSLSSSAEMYQDGLRSAAELFGDRLGVGEEGYHTYLANMGRADAPGPSAYFGARTQATPTYREPVPYMQSSVEHDLFHRPHGHHHNHHHLYQQRQHHHQHQNQHQLPTRQSRCPYMNRGSYPGQYMPMNTLGENSSAIGTGSFGGPQHSVSGSDNREENMLSDIALNPNSNSNSGTNHALNPNAAAFIHWSELQVGDDRGHIDHLVEDGRSGDGNDQGQGGGVTGATYFI